MMSPNMQERMNRHLNYEFQSAKLYLDMAAWFDAENMPGFSHWMKMQFEEEQQHAVRFYDYILARGGRVLLSATDALPNQYDSATDIFQQTLVHEQSITQAINDLYAIAMDERDFATQVFLQFFIQEQVEEEKQVTEILETMKRIENNEHAMMMLDRELATRPKPAALPAN
jgi:ferritin